MASQSDLSPQAGRGESDSRADPTQTRLFPQIVPVRLRDDPPAVVEFHRHQIVGEIARRQLAAHLDEGGAIVGAVDGDDEILARLAFGLSGPTFPHAPYPSLTRHVF